MSLLGVIQRSGTQVTIKRATKARSAGGATNQTWATVATAVPAFIDTPSADIAERLFGREVRTEARLFVLEAVDIKPDDGLLVTAGPRNGERYRVGPRAIMSDGRARSAHDELALVSTTEAFS